MGDFPWIYRGEPWLDFVLMPAAALLCGGLIGLNREFGNKAAGLRTHILVCVGCALFTQISIHGFGPLDTSPPRDPARVAANIVTGLGFIGAGAIWKQGVSTVGLTTAATIWITGAIGMACATGHYLHAAGTTLITVFTLTVLRWVEDRIRPRHPETDQVELVVEVEEEGVTDVMRRMEEVAFQPGGPAADRQGLTLTYAESGRRRLHWRLGYALPSEMDRVVDQLGKLPRVHQVWWEAE